MTGPPAGDALRLALGTFTRLPVRPPAALDRRVAGRAMLLGPVVGLGLGATAAAVLVLALAAGGDGSQPPRAGAADLLAAALAVATLAWLTGGLHLDGLADVADALASRRPPAGALEVMRRPEVGALGATALALVLLLQVTSLAAVAAAGAGPAAAATVVSVACGRAAMVLGCVRGVPPARPDGLGAAVAGTVRRPAAGATVVLVVVLAAALGTASGAGPDGSWAGGVRLAVAAAAGLAVGAALLRRCVRRLGGVTGDVLGAVGEAATTGVLVAAALALAG